MRDDWYAHPQTRELLATLRARARECERRALAAADWNELLALKAEHSTLYGIIKLLDVPSKHKEDDNA